MCKWNLGGQSSIQGVTLRLPQFGSFTLPFHSAFLAFVFLIMVRTTTKRGLFGGFFSENAGG
jgi:hypothetical protein